MTTGFDRLDIRIDDGLRNRGVDVALGAMIYEVGPDRKTDDLNRCVAEEIAAAQTVLGGAKPMSLPRIQAARGAFKQLGKDPSRYRPSSEALLRRIASGKDLYRVNDVVDLSNIISIHTHWPIGSYDLHALQPPIIFRRAEAGEQYRGIGRDDLNLEGLPVFADAKGPFGTPFSDSERTKVGADCREVLTILVGFGTSTDLETDLHWSKTLLAEYLDLMEIETCLIRP